MTMDEYLSCIFNEWEFNLNEFLYEVESDPDLPDKFCVDIYFDGYTMLSTFLNIEQTEELGDGPFIPDTAYFTDDNVHLFSDGDLEFQEVYSRVLDEFKNEYLAENYKITKRLDSHAGKGILLMFEKE